MSRSGQNLSHTSHSIGGSPAPQCSITRGWELAADHLGMEEGHLLNHRHHILQHLPSTSSQGPPLRHSQGLKRSQPVSVSLQIVNVQPLVFMLHFKINILISRSTFFTLKFYVTPLPLRNSKQVTELHYHTGTNPHNTSVKEVLERKSKVTITSSYKSPILNN